MHRAYLAFKAVFIEPGTHTVTFRFDGVSRLRSRLLALIGLMAGLFFCGLFFREILNPPRQS